MVFKSVTYTFVKTMNKLCAIKTISFEIDFTITTII